MNKPIPKSTKAIVIGGGVAGCSTAYHLAKFGWKDVILLERDQLTSGTTWHAAGLVSQLGPAAAVTKLPRRETKQRAEKLTKSKPVWFIRLTEKNEIIEELENVNRSFYGGTMGYFDSNGQMDTCISLRTGLVKNNKLYIQAGGGVVYDSNPEKEYQETINKANALIAAANDSYKYK